MFWHFSPQPQKSVPTILFFLEVHLPLLQFPLKLFEMPSQKRIYPSVHSRTLVFLQDLWWSVSEERMKGEKIILTDVLCHLLAIENSASRCVPRHPWYKIQVGKCALRQIPWRLWRFPDIHKQANKTTHHSCCCTQVVCFGLTLLHRVSYII